MPPELRPTHFAYYPGWMGQAEFFGDLVLGTPLGPAFHKRRLVGDADMQLLAATWDHAHSAERPLDPVAHWTVVVNGLPDPEKNDSRPVGAKTAPAGG